MSLDFGDDFVDKMTSADFCRDLGAHIETISGAVRNNMFINHFRHVIIQNQHLFRGRVVLNLRCGIGILALFAARAKAAKVYAVDESNVLDYTRRIIKDNDLQNTIEVFQCNIEDLELPVSEVDIIICDWMGYALLHQSACLEVLYARDKWLKKPGGLILPNRGQILMALIEDRHRKAKNIDWWQNVYNFNMSCIRNDALKEPKIVAIKSSQLLTDESIIHSINLHTAQKFDLCFSRQYYFRINRAGGIDGFTLFFKVIFDDIHKPSTFSTKPKVEEPKVLQTACYFNKTIWVNKGNKFYGGLSLETNEKNTNKFDLSTIIVTFEMLSGDPMQDNVEVAMTWNMQPCTFQ